MKAAGILGGMGPGTTADFYKDINALSEQQGQTDRPELLIWNVPLNYQVEQDLLNHQRGLEKYLPLLIRGAKKLEAAGSDFVVIPCNTVHELYDEFSTEVDIPFLHIIDETSKHLRGQGVGRTAVLATGQTIGSGMYQNSLAKSDIECVLPDDSAQERLDGIVARLVSAEGASAASKGDEDSAWLNSLVDRYVQDVGSVVLGCTDFHIMLADSQADVVVDSMHVLAEATVSEIYR
ncbi:MAG TPA: amino acid racemase [Candidatus Saccharimonadales bacterium]|nr:amino acid racemase [Candidatus Saccharimonadales bacterium]